MKNKAMTMGVQYLKQAIQALQNLALDVYKKVLTQQRANAKRAPLELGVS
jgi:hypothetical protein